MKKIIALLLLILSPQAFAADSGSAPTIEVSAQETCREYIVAEPKITIRDWPRRALEHETNAYVVISYDLDGSGKASNAIVTDSVPKGLFDKSTMSILARTEFKAGVKVKSCTYVRTYGSVRRVVR